jgi:phosphonatase-like hydrolase
MLLKISIKYLLLKLELMNIKMVVLDMAGTTVDEDNVVYKTLHKSIKNSGFDISYQFVLDHGAGKEKLQALKDIMDQANIISYPLNEIYSLFLKLLNREYDNLEFKAQPYALELFQNLKDKNIKVILNTGYNQETANKILEKLNWTIGNEIDALITASQVTNARPAPDMIFLARDMFSIKNANEIAKVGDSIIDIQEGKNAGCALNIGVLTGAHNKDQLSTASPDLIIHNLSELFNIF